MSKGAHMLLNAASVSELRETYSNRHNLTPDELVK